MLTRRRVIAAKVEAVEGTMEAITLTDSGILATNVKFEPNFNQVDRNVMLNTLSNMAPVMGSRSVGISFSAELKGAGAAYSATIKPAVGVYFRGSGMLETMVLTAGSESATYTPASTGVVSLTIWVYEDGLIKKAKGCRGSYKISGKTGDIVTADFTFTGVFDSVIDGTMISPTFESTVPPVLLGSSLSLDAVTTMVADSFSIDLGNQVQLRSSFGSADGYMSALITGRKPTGTLDPETTLVATYDFIGKWKSGNQAALVIGPVTAPTGLYNKFTITAPKCVYTKVGESDRNGIMVSDLAYSLVMNTGDDELSIAFIK